MSTNFISCGQQESSLRPVGQISSAAVNNDQFWNVKQGFDFVQPHFDLLNFEHLRFDVLNFDVFAQRLWHQNLTTLSAVSNKDQDKNVEVLKEKIGLYVFVSILI